MKIWCETCKGKRKIKRIDSLGLGFIETHDCLDCNGKGYTEQNQPTTEINIDYYEELKAKADKWVEKETPYKIKEIYIYEGWYCGDCVCGEIVKTDADYCLHCGQKLNWEVCE